MTKSSVHSRKPPTIRQLPLPFPVAELTGPAKPSPLLTLTPQQVWANLPRATRTQVRNTALHIIQEVLNESRRA
jgi:hypothetical protein